MDVDSKALSFCEGMHDARLMRLSEQNNLFPLQVRAKLQQLCDINARGCLDVHQAHTLLAAAAACRDLQAGLGGQGAVAKEREAAAAAAGEGGSSLSRPIDFVNAPVGPSRDLFPQLLMRLGVQPPLTAAAARGLITLNKK